jgi:TonB-linked SusC/RagA family outer membrane protein
MIFSANWCYPKRHSATVFWSFLKKTIQTIFLNSTVMRLHLIIFLMLLTALVAAAASVKAQNVTLKAKATPLYQIFKQVEKQTGYRFWYSGKMLGKNTPITISITNLSLKAALDKIFTDIPFTYEIVDQTIVVKEKPIVSERPKEKQDKQTITGTVIDENGEPLVGASVTIKGTSQSTKTNNEGKYSFSDIADNVVLIVTYVGYSKQEVNLKNAAKITLQRSDSKLDDVQVIAYGTTTKRLGTGSISKISAAEIEKRPVSNILAALDGLAPGLTITQSMGVAGGSFKVEVRGRTTLDRSLSDDQPLFVIDGIPVSANNSYLTQLQSAVGRPDNSVSVVQPGGVSPLNTINPQDIESIEILKDADATSIYGSRGANGVILITTKRGKAGKTAINLNAYYGISSVANPIEMLSTEKYLSLRRKAFELDNVVPTTGNAYDLLVWDTARYTDFTKLFTGNQAVKNNIQFSLSGGGENTQFMFSANYNKEKAIFSDELSYTRGSSTLNVNHRSANRKLAIQLSANYSTDSNDILSLDLASNLTLPPNLQLYDSNGSLAWDEGGIPSGFWNPLSYFNRKYLVRTKSLSTSGQINYEIIKDVKLKANMGYNMMSVDEQSQYPLTAQNPAYTPNRYTDFASNNLSGWIIEPQAEFSRNTGIGKINVLLGATFQSKDQAAETLNASGYSNDNLMSSLQGATSITGRKSISPYRYNALFARVQYNWHDKYLGTFSGRRDGSSVFAPENRFSNFGAVGLTWIFSEEHFLKNVIPFLDFGKIRSSIGTTGNDKISNYQFLDTWTTSPVIYNGTSALYPTKLYNPDYKWEKTLKKELGIDLSFLSERVMLSVNYFNNRSSNQLISYKLPQTTGFASVVRNLDALIENQGWEFSLNTVIIRSNKWKWTSNLNFTVPKNRLLRFPELKSSSYNYSFVEGESLNVLYGYKSIGVDASSGLYRVEDTNSDNAYNIADYHVLGNRDPKIYGGFSNSLSYKKLSFSVLFSFRKQTGYSYLYNVYSNLGTTSNLPAIVEGNFWDKQGDMAQLQRPSQTTSGAIQQAFTNLFKNSDGVIEDASFIRLKNVMLDFDISGKMLKRLQVAGAHIYLQAENLFTITGYKLGDPEIQNWMRTPPLRTFALGLNVSF